MNPITTDILSVFPGLGGAFSSGRNDREHRANHVCTRRYCWDLLVLHRKPQWLNQKMQPWRGLRGFLESHWVWMPGPDPGASRGIPFSRPATAASWPTPQGRKQFGFQSHNQGPFQLEISTSLSSNMHRTAQCSRLHRQHCGSYMVSSSHSLLVLPRAYQFEKPVKKNRRIAFSLRYCLLLKHCRQIVFPDN